MHNVKERESIAPAASSAQPKGKERDTSQQNLRKKSYKLQNPPSLIPLFGSEIESPRVLCEFNNRWRSHRPIHAKGQPRQDEPEAVSERRVNKAKRYDLSAIF
jgi:hypothetical protein